MKGFLRWLVRAAMAATIALIAVDAKAAKIDFEDLTGPSLFADVVPFQPQHLDHYDNVGGTGVDVVFDGGVILDETFSLPANQTSIYGTAFLGETGGAVLPDVLTIGFSQPVSNLFFDVINGWNQAVTYRVEDNAGHVVEFTLPQALLAGQTRVFLPLAGDTVTVRPLTFGPFDEFDFFVDNIQFNEPVPEPATLVLLGSGLVGAAIARRRRRYTSAK